MKVLVILNDAPYGSEHTYNGLRLAASLAKQSGVEVKVFLAGDAASCPRVARRCRKATTTSKACSQW